MSIDTEAKRRSAGKLKPFKISILPDGSISAADRAAIGRIYSGIAILNPPAPPAVVKTYRNIADGLAATLETGITNLKAFAYPPDTVNHLPSAILLPEALDLRLHFQGNDYDGAFRVLFLVASGDVAEGFIELYDHIDPVLVNKSVIAAVRADKTLDGSCDDSDVLMIENIGRRELWGQLYFAFDAVVRFTKTLA